MILAAAGWILEVLGVPRGPSWGHIGPPGTPGAPLVHSGLNSEGLGLGFGCLDWVSGWIGFLGVWTWCLD